MKYNHLHPYVCTKKETASTVIIEEKKDQNFFISFNYTNDFIVNKIQSNLVVRNFLVTLKLFLNTKSSLSLWSKLAFGHGKWFLKTNLFHSKLSLSPSLTVLYIFYSPAGKWCWLVACFTLFISLLFVQWQVSCLVSSNDQPLIEIDWSQYISK